MTQLEIAIKALEEIRNTQGRVCEIYEICDHVSCSSSYASWAIADQALRLLAQRPADGAFCACPIHIPSYESTAAKCRICGKPPRR